VLEQQISAPFYHNSFSVRRIVNCMIKLLTNGRIELDLLPNLDHPSLNLIESLTPSHIFTYHVQKQA
jgi:hypothetical protein